MFEVLTIIVFCTLATAAPDGLTIVPGAPLATMLPLYKSTLLDEPTHVVVHEPTLAKLGDVIESVPTAVSHQSSTIVHSKSQRIAPIVAPAVRSFAAPTLRSFPAPFPATTLLRYLPFRPFGLGLGSATSFVQANAPIEGVRSFNAAAHAIPTPLYRSFGFTYGHQPLVYATAGFKK